MFGTAAGIALHGAGGSPNLPSNLLLNTLGLGVATFPLLLLPHSLGYECCILEPLRAGKKSYFGVLYSPPVFET